ncbi:MAG: AAA family ATPase, partial [Clostridia bacterium]|nr:AAA family ATPase [Clostridia bacterium]
MEELTPKEIVEVLDKYIVGQKQAKKSVAIALRNRFRRSRLPQDLIDEVLPKNILMIGPTGVGKTEIARRMARLVNAPFVKVEATKFTEVGYVGRDVESMVRDLAEISIRTLKNIKMAEVEEQARHIAEEKIVELLAPLPEKKSKVQNPLEMLFGGGGDEKEDDNTEQKKTIFNRRDFLRQKLAQGELEKELLEIEVEDNTPPMMEVFTGSGVEEMGIQMGDVLGNIFPRKKKHRKVKVSEARRILTQQEAQKLIDMDEIISQGLEKAESQGIIFLDEIDKIAVDEGSNGQDVSRGG